MPNHFHMLCKTKNLPLASSMRKLLTGYVVNFNKPLRRYGHLFQNRYKSIVCQEDIYLKELVSYIHLNPLRARRVREFKDLSKHPYGGHSILMGKLERDFQDADYVLRQFGDKAGEARRN